EAVSRDFPPEEGVMNPFLHLSLHLAVAEQVSIDQPRGIRAAHDRLRAVRGEHEALHVLLECLGETVWQAQRSGRAPDEQAYLECIRRRAGGTSLDEQPWTGREPRGQLRRRSVVEVLYLRLHDLVDAGARAIFAERKLEVGGVLAGNDGHVIGSGLVALH